MQHLSSVEDIAALYARRGGLHYGEGVTQLEHALQCAVLAREWGADTGLVVAALLHDVGHLLVSEEQATRIETDDRHEIRGAASLKSLFGEAVRTPIALHVSAKRYLCLKEPSYFAGLSPASQRSLAVQGGPFTAQEAEAFERRAYWQDAVTLRRFDDAGKRGEASRVSFADFLPLIRAAQTSSN